VFAMLGTSDLGESILHPMSIFCIGLNAHCLLNRNSRGLQNHGQKQLVAHTRHTQKKNVLSTGSSEDCDAWNADDNHAFALEAHHAAFWQINPAT
jgi:hypothetical protein